MSYTLFWEFLVSPGHESAFEAAYAPRGPWSRLFAKAGGFIGTSLLKSADQKNRYLTLDKWSSEAEFTEFQTRFGDEYRALDERLANLTQVETRIGAYYE